MVSYAYLDHRAISRENIDRYTNGQIAAAPPHLLEMFAQGPDYQMLDMLVEKGISGGSSAARALHMLTYEQRHSYMARDLLRERMWVDLDDYNALHVCVTNRALEVAKLLLEKGMDFEKYQQWAEHRGVGHPETFQALSDYWQEVKAEVEQAPAQQMGGQSFG